MWASVVTGKAAWTRRNFQIPTSKLQRTSKLQWPNQPPARQSSTAAARGQSRWADLGFWGL